MPIYKYHIITSIGEAMGSLEAENEEQATAVLKANHTHNKEETKINEIHTQGNKVNKDKALEHKIHKIELTKLG